MKYWSFISYSHKDKEVAKWLHTKLEGLRIPARLRKNYPGSNIPPRLFPIFRDEDELPTSSELGGTLADALSASGSLIVVCSKNSVNSRWVNEEIKQFKLMGKASKIFCLIIDGEPNASDGENPDEECFPEALRYHVNEDGTFGDPVEPIAADIRERANSKDAILRLAAGILGVGYDEFRRRDFQRRQKFLVKLLFIASLTTLAMFALACYAFLARNEAIKQRRVARQEYHRAEANFQQARAAVDRFFVNVAEEDLFLTHGLQPLQQKLLKDAKKYYEGFLEQHAEDPTLRLEIANTRARVGSITTTIGDPQKAIVNFQQASSVYGSLINERPADFELRKQYASCLSEMGIAMHELGQSSEAIGVLKQAVAEVEEVVEALPADQEARFLWETIVINLGPYQRQAGQIDEAASTYQKAWEEWRGSEGRETERIGITVEPTSRSSLLVVDVVAFSASANAGLLRGDEITRIGTASVSKLIDLKEALEGFEPGGKVRISVVRNERDVEIDLVFQPKGDLFVQTVALNSGVLEFEQNRDYGKALLWFERARDMGEAFRAFLAADLGEAVDGPRLSSQNAFLSKVHTYLGNCYFLRKENKKSIQHFSRSLDLISSLSEKNPAVTNYQTDLATTCSMLAALHDQQGDFEKSEKLHIQAIDILQHLRSEFPDDAKYAFLFQQCVQNFAVHFALVDNVVRELSEIQLTEIDSVLLEKFLAKVKRRNPVLESLLAEGQHQRLKSNTMLLLDSLANLLLEQERTIEAGVLWKDILELSSAPEDDSSLTADDKMLVARTHGNLGWLEILRKEFEDSITHSEHALEIDKNQDWIMMNLAHARLLNGEFNKAHRLYSQLYENAQNKPEFLGELDAEFELLRENDLAHPDLDRIIQAISKL